MFKTSYRRSGGLGLGGVVLIGGLLYGTGAGGAILEQMKAIPHVCSSELGQLSPEISRVVCGITGKTIEGISRASTSVGGMLDNTIDGLMSQFAQTTGLGNGNNGQWGKDFGGLGVDFSTLRERIEGGPLAELLRANASTQHGLTMDSAQLHDGNDPSAKLKAALDSLFIGQNYLNHHSEVFQPRAGLGWLQKGASQDEYGLLPQLQLGSLYLNGGNGIASDPQAALRYYTTALTSLQKLNGSNQLGAKQLLSTLPISPEQLQQKLVAVIRAIKQQG